MEEFLKEAGKTAGSGVAIESIPSPIPEVVEPNNNARDFGILVGVIVAAAICAKLYACTAKKK